MIISPQRALQERMLVNIISADQIQQNGIDLTIQSIKKLDENDTNVLLLGERNHCDRDTVPLIDDEYIDSKASVRLEPGIYDILFNESASIPNGVCATIHTRSTVNRGGNFITSGLYDAGFNNQIGAILHVNVPFIIEKNVRVAQIVFHAAEEGTMYNGIYNQTFTA